VLVVTKDLKFIVLKGQDVIWWSHSAALHFSRLSVSEYYEKCFENLMSSKLNLLNMSRHLRPMLRVWERALELATSCYFTTTALNFWEMMLSSNLLISQGYICDSKGHLKIALSSFVWSRVAAARTPRVELQMGTTSVNVYSMCDWTCSYSQIKQLLTATRPCLNYRTIGDEAVVDVKYSNCLSDLIIEQQRRFDTNDAKI
jgi:hypothetical protein